MANVATASLKQNINYNKLIKITFEEAAILVMIKVKIYVRFFKQENSVVAHCDITGM